MHFDDIYEYFETIRQGVVLEYKNSIVGVTAPSVDVLHNTPIEDRPAEIFGRHIYRLSLGELRDLDIIYSWWLNSNTFEEKFKFKEPDEQSDTYSQWYGPAFRFLSKPGELYEVCRDGKQTPEAYAAKASEFAKTRWLALFVTTGEGAQRKLSYVAALH